MSPNPLGRMLSDQDAPPFVLKSTALPPGPPGPFGSPGLPPRPIATQALVVGHDTTATKPAPLGTLAEAHFEPPSWLKIPVVPAAPEATAAHLRTDPQEIP
jgi:hypothetical protein